jgi:hypothetical protein
MTFFIDISFPPISIDKIKIIGESTDTPIYREMRGKKLASSSE